MSRPHKHRSKQRARQEYLPLEEDMEDIRAQEAKQAADVLYSGRNRDVESNPRPPPMRSLADQKELKFSSVRRLFCLVTLFDLLFIFLLWILHASISTLGLQQEFHCQVINYSFDTSLFDIVLLSAGRAILLLLAYALCKGDHWFMVAITTFITCAFLICKVILFNWNPSKDEVPIGCHRSSGSGHPLDYILFLCSFAMAWFETWLLDWKVLPRERKLKHFYNGRTGERAPLIDPEYSRPQYTHYHRQYDQSEQGSTFYSPIGTPHSSESENEFVSDEDDQGINNKKSFHSLPASQSASLTNLLHLSQQDQDYVLKGREAMEAMEMMLKTTEGWKMEKDNGAGVTVQVKEFEKIGKIYKMEGPVDIDGKWLFEELFYKIEGSPKWNPTIAKAKILHTVDDYTDISYNVAKESAGGIVASRDFVTVRHWQLTNGMYISSGQAVTYADMPPTKDVVRGENGPGGWAIQLMPGKQRCKLIWILNTDLKFQGWMPQYIIDQALTGVLVDIHKYVTKRVEVIKNIQKTI
ncbi:stAR-related lipid transfer protein 3-like [Saccoglossus kowalevskii]|uniref:StAR-related lipid transfer protein 3-like n=1 Tax=Saccoglossus kowalevskii TaxID=10224 RepID=A0ABM0MHD5_SACKO|nr:PREDICTED: stAR-related lipid transfer protein 3-like [Saccoglossus kowalevskii]